MEAENGGGLDAIRDIDETALGQTFRLLGRKVLMAEMDGSLDHYHMTVGTIMLELAVLFGSEKAATELINFVSHPSKARMLADGQIIASTLEAEKMVKDLATNHPSTSPWEVIVTYMKDQCTPAKMKRQSRAQLKWAVDVLKLANSRIELFDIAAAAPSFAAYEHPLKLVLRIIDHCLQNRITLPDLQTDLSDLRDEVLIELASFNDPQASMIFGLRTDGPPVGSSDWHKLMTSGAVEGDRHACWLLAIEHLRREGVLVPRGPKPIKVLEKSLGLEFARITLMICVEHPSELRPRAMALAALFRASGQYTEGLKVLADTLELAEQDPKFPRNEITLLEQTIADYTGKDPIMPAYWSNKKLNTIMDSVFDLDECIKDAQFTHR